MIIFKEMFQEYLLRGVSKELPFDCIHVLLNSFNYFPRSASVEKIHTTT